MSVQLLLLVSFSSVILGVVSYSPLVYYKRSQYYYPQSYGSNYDPYCCWYYYNPSQSYMQQPYFQYPLFQPMYSPFMYPSNPVNGHGFQAKHHKPMLTPAKFPSGHKWQQYHQNYPMFLPFPYPFGVPQIQPLQQTSTAIILPKTSPTTAKPTSHITSTTTPIATTVTPEVTTIVPSSTVRTTSRSWLFPPFLGGNNPDVLLGSNSETTTKDPTTIAPTTIVPTTEPTISSNKEYGAEVDSDLEGGSGALGVDDEDLI